MRGRCSRRLGVLAKATFLLWLLWLGYIFLARSSFPGAGEDDNEEQDIHSRDLSLEESGSEAVFSRPLYLKPSPDNNAPGEWGRATHLNLSPEEKKQEQDSVERYAINIFVSDKISLHRHIQDNRMSEWVQPCVRSLLFPAKHSSISGFNTTSQLHCNCSGLSWPLCWGKVGMKALIMHCWTC